MKVILLNGSDVNDRTGERVRKVLTAQLQEKGWQVENYALCDQKIGNCAGDFFCWIRTPGTCNVQDDNRRIAADVIKSDLVVYLSPVVFGGYSSILKRMVDHLIQNVSPFFTMLDGETHHRKRYQRNPDLLAVGWMEEPDEYSETIFRHLVQRNAINWHANTWVVDVIMSSQTDDALQASAKGWVEDIQNHKSSPQVKLPQNDDSLYLQQVGEVKDLLDIKRALLLVGSPKTRKSTSNSLGAYMFHQLELRSIQTKTIYLHTVLRNDQKMRSLLAAVEAADLVTLAFPLYVDSLPAPVIEAMQHLARYRQEGEVTHRQLFAAVTNCGFPEVYQCNNALAICENFARQTGFEWAGSLALGAGEAINGASLVELGGQTIRMRKSLELAAEALSTGQEIPQAARDGLAAPVIPNWLYRFTGWLRWNRWAKSNGTIRSLKHQPYLPETGWR